MKTFSAFSSMVLSVLTVFFPDWIEWFGINPDSGNGSIEILVVVIVFTWFSLHVVVAVGSLVRRKEL